MMTAENCLLKPNKEQNKEVQRNDTLCQFSGFTYQEIIESTQRVVALELTILGRRLF